MVVEEEGPASDGEFVNFLAVELDFSVFGYFHTRHTLQQVFKHRIGAHAERRCVNFHRILFDHNRVTYVTYHGRFQIVFVHLQLDYAHIHLPFPEITLFHKGFVAHHLHVDDIAAVWHLFQFGFALRIREGEIGDGGVL